MSGSGIKVSAPATISNIAGGLNTLGLALEGPSDEIVIKEGKQKGLVITTIQGGSKRLSTDILKNPAGLSAHNLLTHLGESERPLELEIHKKNPLDAGLGSTAALCAAGVFAVNEYLRTGLSKQDILPFAIGNYQINNGDSTLAHVIPSLMGGMTLITDQNTHTFKKLYIPTGLSVAVIYPHVSPLQAEVIDKLFEKEVTFKDSLDRTCQLASMVAAMYTSDLELMSNTLHQVMELPEMSGSIPHHQEIREIALKNGATGFGIAGFGPSMFVLCTNSGIAKTIIEEANTLYKIKKIGTSSYYSKINHEGAISF